MVGEEWNPEVLVNFPVTNTKGTGTFVDPAYIFVPLHILSSAETLNFLLVRNELISFPELVEKFSFDYTYSKPELHAVRIFHIQEYRSNIQFLLKFRVTWIVSFVR